MSKSATLRTGLATEEDINSWSHGEVQESEIISCHTLKPEKDSLFGKRVFGPTKDWECACGKNKHVHYKDTACSEYGAEVTRSEVRRKRVRHTRLAVPAIHI